MKNKVLIFDCDGTVLDTFDLIEHIVFCTFKELYPKYPLTLDEAHAFFGPYIADVFKKYAKTDEEVSRCLEVYAKYASLLTEKYIKIYPGMKEALTYLKQNGYIITIASNKISKEVYRGLKICGIEELVDYVVGAEMMEFAKPNPDSIFKIMNKYQVSNAIMIGDTVNDIKAGQNAGIFTVGVTWCKTSKETFQGCKADEIINDPLELKNIGIKYEKIL